MFITYACCLSVLLAFRTELAAPQIPAKEMEDLGLEVRTLDRASFWSRGSLKSEFTGKSQPHDEYEYGSRVPGLVEVVLCNVRKLQEAGCASALLLTFEAIK